MPEYLKKFLEALTDEQADECWAWFDGGDAYDAIKAIAESHPVVKAKNAGGIEIADFYVY